jgi:N-acetylglucosamine-6-phosphate deacetylase
MRLGVAAALVDGILAPGDVELHDGTITRVGLPPAGTDIAAPGFVDLHVNGFAGVDFLTAERAAYAHAREAILATGTTTFLPTFISAPESALLAALAELPDDLAAHLEGPFLSPRRLGAHDPADRADPDLRRLTRALDHRVAMVTLAPELPGADGLIDELIRRGIAVSAGHTDATAAEAHRAFDRGVRTVTHLFNAMRPSTHRDPSIAYAALVHPGVIAQLIADLRHVSADAVRLAFTAGRVALVTDATAAAAMPDGAYTLAGRPIRARGGKVTNERDGLAGTALTMLDAVRNVHGLGVPLQDALNAACDVPARVIRRPDLGRLRPGARADVVILDDRLEVRRVLVNGGERVAR